MKPRRSNPLALLLIGFVGSLGFTACFFLGPLNDYEVSIRVKGSGQVTFGGRVCSSGGGEEVCQKFFDPTTNVRLVATPADGWQVAQEFVNDPTNRDHPCDAIGGGSIPNLSRHTACLVTFIPVVDGSVPVPVEAASATAELIPDGDMFPIGAYAEPPQYPGAEGEVEVSVENGVVTLDVSVRGLPANAEWDVWIDADGITEGNASTSDNWRLMGSGGLSTDSAGAGQFNVSVPWEPGDHVWAVFINAPRPGGLTVMISHNVAFQINR